MPKQRVVKRVRTPSGFRWKVGGKFASARKVAAIKKARKRRKPAKKRTAAPKRNPVKRLRVGKRKRATRRRRRVVKPAGNMTAAARMKRNAPKRRVQRKAAVKRTVRKKTTRRTTRRNPVAKKRRTRRRMPPRYKSGPKKGQFKPKSGVRRKRRVKRNPPAKKRAAAPKRKRKRGKLSKQSVMQYPTPRSRKKVRYRVRRKRRVSKKGSAFYTYSLARSNPGGTAMSAIKGGLAMYAGFLGTRVLGNVITKHVMPSLGASIPSYLQKTLPAAAVFAASVWLLPKVLKGKGEILRTVQMGSVMALADAVANEVVKLAVTDTTTLATVKEYTGLGQDVYVPMAMGEYTSYDNRLGYGEYLDHDNRLGDFDVHEALADDEVAFMNAGGGGGIFARTSLADAY